MPRPVFGCVHLPEQKRRVHGQQQLRNRVLHGLAQELELPKLTFQVIRRTIATLAQKKGTEKDIQGVLRHSRIATTTDVYMQEIPESVQRTFGSQRLQLTDSSMVVGPPRRSPDGKRIAFSARKPSEDWKIYVVSADGGTPEQLTPGDGSLDPSWYPDGNFLASSPDYSDLNSAVDFVDLRTHHVSAVPGSEGLFSPHWSRDGRFLFALSHKLQNSQKLLMYTFATQKWEQLLLAKSIDYPTWSRSGEYIHFFDIVEDGTPFYRVRVTDHKLERIGVVSLSRGMAKGQFAQWTGLAPDDSPLLL